MGVEAALLCLAMTVYFEARSEPIIAQYAVAEVVLNRVADRRYPNTVCAVVTQDKGPKEHDCQFSFYCDGKPEKMTDKKARQIAFSVAKQIIRAKTNVTEGALYYHVDTIRPNWSKKLQPVAIIGTHLFLVDKE